MNALHRASGRQDKDAPSKWLRSAKTKSLIAEIESQTGQICTVSTEGRNGGTFAHEILAVEYAGWVSPDFRIQVNQAFIDNRTVKVDRSQAAPLPLAVDITIPNKPKYG
ncbi:KilA-N domain-containing protein [Shimia marina]|uniref:KilA-N domain protein n=2 Tax=Shimia marina TaxID=321267 RepID=A0A0P1ERY8_9RHOB|nr:KilA-N domain protein [Shimia marina]SFD93144.1 KilA-N domain-containing protein [Shimia marina]